MPISAGTAGTAGGNGLVTRQGKRPSTAENKAWHSQADTGGGEKKKILGRTEVLGIGFGEKKDGKVSKDEAEAYARMTTTSSPSLSRSPDLNRRHEVAVTRNNNFNKDDKNGDGNITKNELDTQA